MDIFLGEPPANIKRWIIDHAAPPVPAEHPETRFTLSDGSVKPHDITGPLDQQWMIDNGYFDEDEGEWIKTITQADIGNTVTSIGEMAFGGCTGLTSVTIGNRVTSIGEEAFGGCTGLTSVTIGNRVTSIGNRTFDYCISLTNLTIPDSVTSIGDYAFSYCSGLTSMTFNSFTKNQINSMTTENHIFGVVFYDRIGESMAKSFTTVCTDGSMTINFSADNPATITFTDL